MEILACPKCQGNQITKAASLTANKDICAKMQLLFLTKSAKK
jgi:uncharacterized protein YbaR (Trm112 family)